MIESYYHPLRILVVDDDRAWRKLLRLILKRHLGRSVKVTATDDYRKARVAVSKDSYDLVSVDLKLSETELGGSYSGRSLLDNIRRESREPRCGLIILSGFGTEDIAVESLRDYHVDDFIKKSRVTLSDPSVYIAAIRRALLRSLLVRASTMVRNRIVLTLTSNRRRLLQGELRAFNRVTKIARTTTNPFNAAALLSGADVIGQQIIHGRKGMWRRAAKRLGREIFDNLRGASPIYDLFVIGRELAGTSSSTLQLEFSGPLQNVKLPFELMYDNDYLVFNHIMTRSLSEGTSRSERFHEFIKRISAIEGQQRPNTKHLQVVIVGVNNESGQHCEREARAVGTSLTTSLEALDVPHEVKTLIGKQATYRNLEDSLREGCHIFHFAGHADYERSLPEKSVIHLFDRSVSAANLRSLFREKDTQFVFLSCCLSANVASKTARGDFYGFLDAFYQVGTPTILGYRWPVNDYSANLLAVNFYRALFRNLCPAHSLLRARELAATEIGRDEDIWASAVLFMQN